MVGQSAVEDPLETAKNILGKLKHAKLFDAFQAWKNLADFESTVEAAEDVLEEYEDILNTDPHLRTNKGIHLLCRLLSKVKAYSSYPQPVLELLATHCRLLLVWDSIELPRGPEDSSSLFSVVSGGMCCVTGDTEDPVLRCMVKEAADQLLEVELTEQHQAAVSQSTPFAGSQSRRTSQNGCDTATPAAAAAAPAKAGPTAAGAAQTKKRPKRSETLRMLGLPPIYAVGSVHSRLWHTVVQMVHSGRMPSRKEAELKMAQFSHSLSGTGKSEGGQVMRKSQAGKGAPPPRISFAGGLLPGDEGAGARGGGGAAPSARQSLAGVGAMSRRSSMAGTVAGGGAGHSSVSVLNLAVGDSFSGKELDCRAETGFSEGAAAADPPPRALAAITLPNTLTALLVVSKAVFQRAVRSVAETLVQQTVASCCRLPFLRHTPLKELFRLSRNLVTATYTKGDVLLHQDRDCNNVYFLLEGEVDVCVDVPMWPGATHTLTQGGTRGKDTQDSSTGGLTGTQGGDKPKAGSLFKKGAKPTQPLQRVVLARRGPGSVLGDDALRDKQMVVSAVVHSATATILWTTQNRFTMCADPLTLRLFHKLRGQQSASLDIAQSVASVAVRDSLLERCRGTVLHETYAHQEVLPNTLQRPQADSLITNKPPPPWVSTVERGGFFSMPVSMEAGIRAAALAKAGIMDTRVESGTDNAKSNKGDTSGGVTDSVTQSVSVTSVTGGGCPLCEEEMQAKFGPLPVLSKGMSSSWLRGVSATDSIHQLKDMIQKLESERAAEAARGCANARPRACPHRVVSRLEACVTDDMPCGDGVGGDGNGGGVVRVLDIRERLIDAASKRVGTDIMEAACVALVRVEVASGQRPHTADELAPVLDDAYVCWSSLAHTHRLTLVRWSSHESILLAPIEPHAPQTGPSAAGRRPVVRLAANTLLAMRDALERIVATNKVPHLVFHAGLAVGTAFVGLDTGHFISSVSGVAYDAAQRLCAGAQDTFPSGGILCSDSVMQAISRTHVIGFAGQGYQLIAVTDLPCNVTFEQILGHDAVAAEPTAGAAGGGGALARRAPRVERAMVAASGDVCGALSAEVSSQFVGSAKMVSLCDGLPTQRVAPTHTTLTHTHTTDTTSPTQNTTTTTTNSNIAVSNNGQTRGRRPALKHTAPPHTDMPHTQSHDSSQGVNTTSHDVHDVTGSHTQPVSSSDQGRWQTQHAYSGHTQPSVSGVRGSLESTQQGCVSEGHVRDSVASLTGPSASQGATNGTRQGVVCGGGRRRGTAAMREELGARKAIQVREQLKAELRQLGCNHPAAGDHSRIPHATFKSTHRTNPHTSTTHTTTSPFASHSMLAASATNHLNVHSKTVPLLGDSGDNSHLRHGFLSRTSAELVVGVGQGRAKGAVSPHAPVIHMITPYGPGSGPLADLPARDRAADVLFTGAALAALSGAPPVATARRAASPGRSADDPLDSARRGGTQLSKDATRAAARAVASPPRSPGCAVSAAHVPTSAAAAVAAVAAGTRPISPSRSALNSTDRHSAPSPIALSSPFLRPISPPHTQAHTTNLDPPGTVRVPTNLGMLPVVTSPTSQTDTPNQQNTQGLTHTNLSYGSGRLQRAASPNADRPESRGVCAGAGTGRVSPITTPVGYPAKVTDPVTGMTGAAIHKQAVAAWKDLGSVRAAEQYVRLLPPGVLNVSFSTANLSQLPTLGRLSYLESVAGAFNPVQALSSQWVAALSPHLRVLCLSHTMLTSLPDDFGHHLPSLTELNLSCCMLERLPESLGMASKLRALSVEQNSIRALPDSIRSLDGLRHLHIGHNQLTQLPDCLDAFTALEVLHAQANQLTELPNTLAQCTGLMSLDVGHNALRQLPPNTLNQLTGLRHLNLQHNKLCSCPQVHGALAAEHSQYQEEGAFEEPLSRASSRVMPPALHEALSRTASHTLPHTPSHTNSRRSHHQITPPSSHINPHTTSQPPTHTTNSTTTTNSRPTSCKSRQSNRKSRGLHVSTTDPGVVATDLEKPLETGSESGENGHNGRVGTLVSKRSRTQPGEATGSGGEEDGVCGVGGMGGCSTSGVCGVRRSNLATRHAAQGQEGGGHDTPSRRVGFQRESSDGDTHTNTKVSMLGTADDSAGIDTHTVSSALEQPAGCYNSHSAAAAAAAAAADSDAQPAGHAAAAACQQPQQRLQLLQSQQLQQQQAAEICCPRLRFLSLAGNQLTSCPGWLPPTLTHLDLSKNILGPALPDWFCSRLTSLRHLCLQFNQLETIPNDINSLTALALLAIENNPVTDPEHEAANGGEEEECVSRAYDWVMAIKAKARRDQALGGKEAAQQLSDILADPRSRPGTAVTGVPQYSKVGVVAGAGTGPGPGTGCDDTAGCDTPARNRVSSVSVSAAGALAVASPRAGSNAGAHQGGKDDVRVQQVGSAAVSISAAVSAQPSAVSLAAGVA